MKRWMKKATLTWGLLASAMITGCTSSGPVLSAQPQPGPNTVWIQDTFESGKTDLWSVESGKVDIVTDGGSKALAYTSDGTSGIALTLKPEVWQPFLERASDGFFVEVSLRPTSDPADNSDKNIGLASHLAARDGKPYGSFYYAGINFNNRYQVGIVPSRVKGYQNVSGVPNLKLNGAYRTDFYRLRYEFRPGAKDVIMLYVNDIPLGKNNIATPYTIPDADKINGEGIGIYTCGASFVMDSVKIGPLTHGKSSLLLSTQDPSYVQLSGALVYQRNEKALRVNDAPLSFKVRAARYDGTPDTVLLSADNNNLSLSTTEINSDEEFTVSAVAMGTTTVTIAQASNPANKRWLVFSIAKGLDFVSTNYPALDQGVTPVPGATNVYPDDGLKVSFDAPPTLIPGGYLTLTDLATGTVVDTIRLSGEKNTYGSRQLFVGSQLVTVQGRSLEIIPHKGVLKPGRSYAVGIPNGVVQGTLGGVPFTGFSPQDRFWNFTVQASPPPPQGTVLTVGKTGPTNFRTIQAALDYGAGLNTGVTVTLAKGIYRENLTWEVPQKLTLKGAPGTSSDQVIIAFENANELNGSTDGRALFLIKTAPLVRLEGLTIENTRKKAGTNLSASNQAETLYFNNPTGVLVVNDSRLISRQDTLLLKGFSRFTRSLISGDVDFIWGYPDLALFEDCEINARQDDRKTDTPAYVLQARAIAGKRGFVFLDCRFTAASERSVPSFVARSGGAGTPTADWDSVALIRCTLSPRFAPVLWSDEAGKAKATPGTASALVGWREYGSRQEDGTPADTTARLKGSYQITEAEYQELYSTRAKITVGTPLEALN